MELKTGSFYTIQGVEYFVLSTFEKYALLLNNSSSELNGSGNVILIEQLDNKNAKVIKDKDQIKSIIDKMMNN